MNAKESIRLATPLDKSSVEVLLRKGFGDEDWFLFAFFEYIWQRYDVFLSCEGDMPAAMAAFFPAVCHIPGKQDTPETYLYALTTLPEYRGQGHARALLSFARRRYGNLFLHPASENLGAFYRSLGWQDTCYVRRLTQPSQLLPCHLSPASPAEFVKKRGHLLENLPHLLWDEQLTAFARKLFQEDRGGLYISDTALCSVLGIQEDTLVCTELIGDPHEAAALAYFLGCAFVSYLQPCEKEETGAVPRMQSVGAHLPFSCLYGFDFD